MANVTAAMVKELREKTGTGMMDCKNALNETGGDIEAAVDWLRKKGLSKAAKKAGRVAAEGLIALDVEGTSGVLVEVNSETDFVARNEDFQFLVRNIARVAIQQGLTDVEALKGAHYPAGGVLGDAISEAVAKIGENMTLRRAALIHVPTGAIGSYMHNSVTEGLGKIGVLVGLATEGNAEAVQPLAREIALHIAAAAPLAIDASGLDPAVVEREKAVLAEKNAGKPANVLEKIVESGLKSFYKETCLLDQVSNYPEHAGKTIGQVLKDTEKAAGAPVTLVAFYRYALGEGIEKQESDFAAEVAAAASGQA
ncbi:translation elongation factor Ts [Beijerinckia indica]|uniref:Elongation factor Ts n=1 Tax=Beijerinckia indica subsp. indica (strain ATCC 9039 / DSM 1715 / NCIMB 8712) TaxID=395963 RepID=EFTS_BEII9|nr:translation elongation factor Ts [Beijerinckia indica]B2IGT1.1 RecName: Full=Elongation factor Ts; Short=EF-Ts [Beijerinckia indica subsp. indica ATCC 9039]ACB95842.1 translation elongation factor Ts [Beijerinckia indica subsp. indica ATCC 9039]